MGKFRVLFFAGLIISNLMIFNNCSDVDFSKSISSDVNSAGIAIEPGEESIDNDSTPTQVLQTYAVPAIQSNKVDILFLVDTSGSMSSIQSAIGERFSTFIESITSSKNVIDWQVAITTTNMQTINGPEGSHGQLVPLRSTASGGYILTPKTNNVAQSFYDTIRLPESKPELHGNDGDDDERGIFNANMVIDRKDELGHGFFRPGADLHMIMVTDENERSNGKNLDNYDLPQSLIENVAKNLPSASFVVHSVIDFDESSIYQDLSKATGGKIEDISSSDYSDTLKSIGRIISQAKTKITLKCAPVGPVVVNSSPVTNIGHSVSGSTLSFDNILSPNTVVTLTYNCKEG